MIVVWETLRDPTSQGCRFISTMQDTTAVAFRKDSLVDCLVHTSDSLGERATKEHVQMLVTENKGHGCVWYFLVQRWLPLEIKHTGSLQCEFFLYWVQNVKGILVPADVRFSGGNSAPSSFPSVNLKEFLSWSCEQPQAFFLSGLRMTVSFSSLSLPSSLLKHVLAPIKGKGQHVLSFSAHISICTYVWTHPKSIQDQGRNRNHGNQEIINKDSLLGSI